MRIKALSAVPASLFALLSIGAPAPAMAGDVSNAQLECIVDTIAYDYPGVGECASVWYPWYGSNTATAYFSVIGMPAGSYTYYWTDMNTGKVGVCPTTAATCTRSIFRGGMKTMRVTVIDNATGASNTVFATAEYIDGYN